MTKISVVVYGAEVVCASCVNAPTSIDTHHFEFTYIDIRNDTENLTDHDMQFIERINEDELFYPLVTMNDEYVADGYIQYKQITRFIKSYFTM